MRSCGGENDSPEPFRSSAIEGAGNQVREELRALWEALSEWRPTFKEVEETITKRDLDFLALARFWANKKSKDPNTRVGAVLVGTDWRDIALGWNGFPPGIEDKPELLNNREEKLKRMVHAERNALDNARFDTKGATLYVTLCPCSECAKSIISKGIARVVCYEASPEQQERWGKDFGFSLSLLKEAGVSVEFVDEEQTTEQQARKECARQGIDPDELVADGGVESWMVMAQQMTKKVSGPTPESEAYWKRVEENRGVPIGAYNG